MLFGFISRDVATSSNGLDDQFGGIVAAFEIVRESRDEYLDWRVMEKMLGGVRSFLIRDSEEWKL